MIGGAGQNIPPVTKNLIIINALLLLATTVLGSSMNFDVNRYLALHFFMSDSFNVLQYITYMFMHADMMHLLFNMFALWMFGRVLEQVWGPKKFFTYYVLTGIGAGLLHTGVSYWELRPSLQLIDGFLQHPDVNSFAELVKNHKFALNTHEIAGIQNTWKQWLNEPGDAALKGKIIDYMISYRSTFANAHTVVGASGSVFGILLAFGYIFPNMQLQLMLPPMPIKAKYMVMGYGVFEIIMVVKNNPTDNVAHFAHLGGMLFGFLLLKYWNQKRIQ